MKKFGNYLRNPAGKRKKKRRAKRNPFALTAINPVRRKRKAKRKFARALARPLHQARRKKRRKNPLEVQHVIASVPSRNPHRKKRRKKNSRSNRNPPMSKKRKRRSRRSRNPVSHTRRRRSSRRSRRRNPARRRNRMMRRRNPVAIVRDIITRENIEQGVGVLIGIFGTRLTVNALIQGDPQTGARMFDLPGITYSTAAAPLTQAQFTAKNKWWLAFYEAAIPAVAGFLTRGVSPNISKGLYQSTIVNIGIAALRGTQMGQKAGLNAFLPRGRGVATYIPGVPPMLSGPATAFINNGSPVPSGMGAVVNQRWHQQTVAGGANPFQPN